jgi:hypothetical protein
MPEWGPALVFLLMGLFAWAIAGPLSRLATNWNLFLRQDDLEGLEAYRNKKLRGIRLIAKVWIIVAIICIVLWSLGLILGGA